MDIFDTMGEGRLFDFIKGFEPMPKCARLKRCIHNFTCHACSKVDPPSEPPRADWWGRAAFMAARKLAQLCYFLGRYALNVMWGLRDTQEVHWSIQGFMEEIKISLAEFFFFFLGYCFKKLRVHNNFCVTIFKWSIVIGGEKVVDSYENDCLSFTVDHFIKL